MPSVWSWYQAVEGRCEFGYWNVARPGPHVLPRGPALPMKKSNQVPTVANPAGMSVAAGRNHASAYLSLQSWTASMPWTWVTIGTGPVTTRCRRELRSRILPVVPPGGLAQCRVGSTGRRWARKLPLESVSSLIHVTVTGVPRVASMVNDG